MNPNDLTLLVIDERINEVIPRNDDKTTWLGLCPGGFERITLAQAHSRYWPNEDINGMIKWIEQTIKPGESVIVRIDKTNLLQLCTVKIESVTYQPLELKSANAALQ